MSRITPRPQRARLRRTLAVLAALTLLATGCSSPTEDTQPASTTTTPQPRQATAPETTSSSSTTSTSTTTEPPPPPAVLVHVLGSVRDLPETQTLDTPAEERGTETEDTETEDTVSEPAPQLLDVDDATIVSLGCTTSTGCDPADLATWAANFVDAVNLATDSAAADGVVVLGEHGAALLASGVSTIGYGANLEEATTPAIIGADDAPIALFAVSLAEVATETIATADGAGIAAGPDTLAVVAEQVAAYRVDGHRTIVMIDWGRTEERAPTTTDLEQVQLLVDAGADAIVGHGSDFLQRFERIEQTAVAFNLGNAVTATAETLRRDTAVLRIYFDSPGQEICLLPAAGGEVTPVLDDPSTTDCS